MWEGTRCTHKILRGGALSAGSIIGGQGRTDWGEKASSV